MNPHLKRIPSLTPLSTRRLPRRHFQALSRQPHRALDAQILRLRTLNQLLAYFFQRGQFSRRERYSDFVDFLSE